MLAHFTTSSGSTRVKGAANNLPPWYDCALERQLTERELAADLDAGGGLHHRDHGDLVLG
ncbi:MAG TPA: hypothetical protein VFP84_31230 [Kofleriaceae bacterium]|nr:hypothetical protein [Kofleriaceae bacterium]